MENKTFFAVDLGATSGRTVLGSLQDGRIRLQEWSRFDNRIIQTGGHYYWDIYALYAEILTALKRTVAEGVHIDSIGIDTWGVDFVLLGKDGSILSNPICYRDPHTEGMMGDYFETVMTKKEVYRRTGIQFMNFNTLFQLYAMKRQRNSALEAADKILFVPDALSYMLTGNQICEYTIASTGQILDPRHADLDAAIIQSVGLKRSQFGKLTMPGTIIGTINSEVKRITGLGDVPVVAVAGHDTASAVAAVPAADHHFAYLSSGTWSLMGIETEEPIIDELSFKRNFTNEGGIEGTTRFLKNICGMWLYERCRKEWTDAPKEHITLQEEAMKAQPFQCVINPDDPSFANPPFMVQAIQDYCRKTGQHVPEGYAEICRCIFESLALRYRQVFDYLKEMAHFDINVLHIIGGGSKNKFLNQFTADSLGVKVLAGPQECTAIGNVMLQAKACHDVKDIWDMRRIISKSFELTSFSPKNVNEWENAYQRFLQITK